MKLLRLRKEHRWSQAGLAEQLDISQAKVGTWESGTTFPDIREIKRLAEILQVPPDYLIDDTVSEPPDSATMARVEQIQDIVDRYGAERAYWWLFEASKAADLEPGKREGSFPEVKARSPRKERDAS